MYTFNVLISTLAVMLLLPFGLAAPAPDSIFLLQSSTFKPLGCSKTFHPTSILRQVPSPFACFSRCSDKKVAAYSSSSVTSGGGVLCACGEKDMLIESGINIQTNSCRDDTWYLFENNQNSSEESDSSSSTESSGTSNDIEKKRQEKQKRDRLMPFMMMRKKALAKRLVSLKISVCRI
ncbi:uncharacterized protein L201_004260 [Kwoniella dendrophila CBS 6074]|uniref:WSC domain-containing protein n=1 Tax=Kwoniella dendrophila CBS 6074 TaxID=1295534 RepID=A0AAX4JVL3_9TREE